MQHGLKYRGVIAISCLIILGGCNPHKINTNPAPNIQAQVKAYSWAEGGATSAANKTQPWWQEFKRPELGQMIDKAFTANQDLAQALAQVKQARALTVSTGSALYPEVSIEGSGQGKWNKGHRQRGTAAAGGALQWELDFFNRLEAARKSDKLAILAREEDAAALKLSLSSEVANAYFGAIAAHKTLELLQQQLKLNKEFLELTELRLKEGVGTTLETLQQQNLLAESEELMPAARAELRVFENRLDVLLGEMPDGKDRVNSAEDLSFEQQLPALGVPSDLLLNRPNLRVIKTELVAADADIAEAIAARLPRVTLQGSHNFSDSSAFTGPVSILLGSFVQPLLDWGKHRAEVERNKYLYEEKLAEFTQAYLQAAEEVENTAYQEEQQRQLLKNLSYRKEIMQQALNAAKERYQQGVDDYLPVLTALQEMNKIERMLIAENLKLVNFRITLHRAIGGSATRS